jgi:hypothetical protein
MQINKSRWALLLILILSLSSLLAACEPPVAPHPYAGGVLATFEVTDETFRVWVTSSETIEQLYALQRGESMANIPNGPIHRSPGQGDHNAPWNWHLDPELTQMAEITIELCDGAPSFVEANVDYFIDEVGQYCPWAAELLELEDFRDV